MKPSVKIALICTAISAVVSLIFYYTGHSFLGYKTEPFISLFLLLVSIAGGVFMFKQNENFAERSFLEDIKKAMQGGIMFTILASGFIYIYHSKIDPSIVNNKIEEFMTAVKTNVPDEKTYFELQKDDPTWKDKSYLDYMENQEDSASGFISAWSFSIIHTIVGLLLTVFFSIFVTVILRKVVLR